LAQALSAALSIGIGPAAMESRVASLPTHSLYDVLGVLRTASMQELRGAFKRTALVVHPDKGGTKEAFQRVMLAFQTLVDPIQRQTYDRRIEKACCSGDRPRQQKPPETQKASEVRSCETKPHSRRHAPGEADSKCKQTCATATHQASSMKTAARCAERNNPSMRKATCKEHLLEALFRALQLLPALRRRTVFCQLFTEAERVELEVFIRARSTRSVGACDRSSFEGSDVHRVHAHGDTDSSSSNSGTSSDCSSCELSEDQESGMLPLAISAPSESLALCDAEYDHVRQFMLEDEDEDPGESPEHDGLAERTGLGASNSRSTVRGLIVRYRSSKPWYQAVVCIESLTMLSREVLDLETALDYLVILHACKNQIRMGRAGTFEERAREGLKCAFEEHATSEKEIGLRFKVELCKSFWVKGHLDTPMVHNLSEALLFVKRLSPYRVLPGMNQHKLMRSGLLELEAEWKEVRACYVGICVAAGLDKEDVERKLQLREEARRPFRDLQVSLWNQRRMAGEELLQHQFEKEERRLERRNCKGMDLEDKSSRRRQHLEMRNALRVRRLLSKLRRFVARQAAKKCASEGRRRRQHAVEERVLKAARVARWRAMNRRDLTMADIIDRRWEAH